MSEPAADKDDPVAKQPASHNPSGEDGESDDANYIVEKITDVRNVKNKLEFETHWQGDDSLTWEPLSSFPEKLNHIEIVNFKQNFPDKYKIVEEFMAEKTRRKSHKNWSYVELTETEEKSLYEKQDVTAPRELKSLYDPNRLKDNQEEYLKAFDPGVRISRNAIRQLKEGRGIIAESKASGQSTPAPKEKKKRAPGGGRKKKTADEATTSAAAAVAKPPPKRKGRKPAKAKSPAPIDDDDDDDDVFATQPVAPTTSSLADGIDTWTPRRRAVKLNSSDSDSDFEEKKPPPKKKAVVQKPRPAKSPDPKPSSSVTHEPPRKQSAIASQPAVRRVSTEEKRPSPIVPQKRPIREEPEEPFHEPARVPSPVARHSPRRDPDIYYAGVDDYSECEADVARYGLEVFRGDVARHFEKEAARRLAGCEFTQLADAIRSKDVVSAEFILETLKRSDIMTILTTNAPLHEMLAVCAGQPETNEVCEKMVRLILHYVPIEYLKAVDGANNNLVNRAILTGNVSLVRFLVNIGSPLDMKNINRMSAVENALLIKSPTILEIVLNKGGIFHYMMDEFEPCYPYVRDRHYLNSNAIPGTVRDRIKGVARVTYDSIDGLCSRQRTAILPPSIIAHSYKAGPIVCCPRGKLMTHGFKHTIRFRFPVTEHFDNKSCQYMLAAVPVKYDHQDEKFVSRPNGVKMLESPKLNGHDCLPLLPNRKNLPYYNCTEGFHAQAQNPTIWCQHDKPPVPFLVNDFKSIFQLELHIDPSEKLDFLACQVFRIDINPSHNQSTSFGQNMSHNSNFRRGNSNGPNNQFSRNHNQQQRHGSSYNQPGPSGRAPFYQNNRYQNNRPGGAPYNSNQQFQSRQHFNRPGSSTPGPSSSPYPPPSPRY